MVAHQASFILAADVERANLKKKELDQKRARSLGRELIDSILRVQMEQLEENGLQQMQIYRDIKAMRGNVNRLVDSEMVDVVDILVQAQATKSTEERGRKIVEARQLVRTIVAQLSVERQNLLRRLKTAEIVEQVKRLIRLQVAAIEVNKTVRTAGTNQRGQLVLNLIDDQRDVKQLFLHLVETLADVQSWGGAVAQGATDGLRVLKAAEVGQQLDHAGHALEATEYTKAAVHQAKVVQGLKQLLRIVLKTQGIVAAEREQLIEAVRELTKR
ncbi:MAG: hypothetical protein ABGZ17_15200, partial [Planctomycetaceae bacterium]